MTIVWRNDHLRGLGNRVVNQYRDMTTGKVSASNEALEAEIIEKATQEGIFDGPLNDLQKQAIKEFVEDII